VVKTLKAVCLIQHTLHSYAANHMRLFSHWYHLIVLYNQLTVEDCPFFF